MVDKQHDSTSPFHPGEQQVQEKMGVRAKLEQVGGKHIRDHLPDQHREFYAELSFVLLGTVDDAGQPWASIVAGPAGFITSPGPNTLEIAAQPLYGDPLNQTLRRGAEIGLLGLQPETRRRNRLTGRVRTVGPEGFSIAVGRAFGNCRKYIQTREVVAPPNFDTPQAPGSVLVSDRFDLRARDLIERADTLFIASAYLDQPDTPAGGADVSHRGGKPGFIRLEDVRTFVFPDFSGNFHFNTVGNIVKNPKAGFLFVDFDTGDLTYTTGDAEIEWDGEAVRDYTGAERLIRFRAKKVIRVRSSLPLRFTFGEYSPALAHTGPWGANEGLPLPR